MDRENRKVLISVKVSTLLLILILIIAAVAIVNFIKSNLPELQNVANINEDVSENNEIPTRVLTPQISSRGNEEVREEHTTKNEIKVGVIEEPIIEEPIILQGAVGLINVDSVEHSIEESQENIPEPTTPIEEVTISRDMDLTVRTGLSREDFITLISGVEEDTSGFFEENAGLIYDICEKYQINEIFFCGLIAGESGWKIADNHRRTYNYISLMTSNGLIRYSSVEDGLEKAAQALHNNYLTEGGRFYHGPTLAGVKTRFCPASSTWINLIYGNMQRILK